MMACHCVLQKIVYVTLCIAYSYQITRKKCRIVSKTCVRYKLLMQTFKCWNFTIFIVNYEKEKAKSFIYRFGE